MDAEEQSQVDKDREGHRGRLRERFMRGGLVALNDYEIVELLLTLGQPRRDCKQMAKDALERFKDLRGVLDASPEELEDINGIGAVNSFGIRFAREVGVEYLRLKAVKKPVLGSQGAAMEYLYTSMGGLKKEMCKALFLNSQNELLAEETISEGTVNASPVFAREVIEAALRHKAAALIFAHNHPSGNYSPSRDDKAVTRELVMAAGVMGLRVLDHIIIGDRAHYSFAECGLIAQYEVETEGIKRRPV